MWSCSTFYFESRQIISLRSSPVEDKAPPPPPPFDFNQMPIPTVAIGDAMGKIFLVCFNAKGDAIKCVILWNIWEFIAISFCFNGCAILWNV